jgi:hypothetical protein
MVPNLSRHRRQPDTAQLDDPAGKIEHLSTVRNGFHGVKPEKIDMLSACYKG